MRAEAEPSVQFPFAELESVGAEPPPQSRLVGQAPEAAVALDRIQVVGPASLEAELWARFQVAGWALVVEGFPAAARVPGKAPATARRFPGLFSATILPFPGWPVPAQFAPAPEHNESDAHP